MMGKLVMAMSLKQSDCTAGLGKGQHRRDGSKGKWLHVNSSAKQNIERKEEGGISVYSNKPQRNKQFNLPSPFQICDPSATSQHPQTHSHNTFSTNVCTIFVFLRFPFFLTLFFNYILHIETAKYLHMKYICSQF